MPARKRRQRGYVEQLPSGSFRVRVYSGVDPLTRRLHYLSYVGPGVGHIQAAKLDVSVVERFYA